MPRLLIILTIICCAKASKLNVLHEWKYIDYVWKDNCQRVKAIASGAYNATKIFPIDVQKIRDGRIFVTTPRFNEAGVPATLTTISNKRGEGGPLLTPYPNWSWNTRSNCTGVTSVWRVTTDECSGLWILDSGKIGDNQVCPAQILHFDTSDDRLVRRVKIPSNLSVNPKTGQGLLVTLVVDSEGPSTGCSNPSVYIADIEGWGLIMWDGRTNKFGRLDDEVFGADPNATTFSIAGENFTIPDGVLGLALTPKSQNGGDSRLFFRSLASFTENSYRVKDLQKWLRTGSHDVRYTTSKYRFPSQAAAQAISEKGILFFGLTTQIAIACWNIDTPMDDKHVAIVAQDNETLQFASGVKVTKEVLWAMTIRFQKIAAGTQNFKEVNYRVLNAPVASLVKGSACQSNPGHV